jgi:hypothetical protein
MSCESGGVKVDHACSGPNSHELRFRKSASPAQQHRMWISSREMSEQRRAWLVFAVENHGNV